VARNFAVQAGLSQLSLSNALAGGPGATLTDAGWIVFVGLATLGIYGLLNLRTPRAVVPDCEPERGVRDEHAAEDDEGQQIKPTGTYEDADFFSPPRRANKKKT